MTRRDWSTVAKFALVCALAGPLLGLALFWWLPLAVGAILEGSLGMLALVSVWLVANAAMLLPISIVPAAVLGAGGTWLLVARRARGQGQRAAQLTGTGYGAVAGVAMSVLSAAQGQPYGAFGGGLTLVMGAVESDAGSDSMLSMIGGAAAGAGTGLLLGLFVAERIRKSSSDHARSDPGS